MPWPLIDFSICVGCCGTDPSQIPRVHWTFFCLSCPFHASATLSQLCLLREYSPTIHSPPILKHVLSLSLPELEHQSPSHATGTHYYPSGFPFFSLWIAWAPRKTPDQSDIQPLTCRMPLLVMWGKRAGSIINKSSPRKARYVYFPSRWLSTGRRRALMHVNICMCSRGELRIPTPHKLNWLLLVIKNN